MRLSGAGASLCAIHHSSAGNPHPHVWNVRAWVRYDGADAEALKLELQTLLSRWDHGTLPRELSRGEDLAAAIGGGIRGCVLVELDRPSEQLFARWEADGGTA